MTQLRTVLDGLAFPEGPRWHDGRLWFSDMHAHEVVAVDMDGNRETICEVPTRPSGLGWLPDGRLLVVSMTDRKLLRREADGSLVEHADMSAFATGNCNDMAVDASGRAYVGNFGFDMERGEQPAPAVLILVTPDGQARPVADDMHFPNGTVITPDGKTLIVGESTARRLTAFDIEADGSLTNRRLFAEIGPALPDGICLDAEGAVWVASPRTNEVLRVLADGTVGERISTGDRGAFACMLGGPERRTLFVLVAGSSNPEECARNRNGAILATEVAISGDGLP
jgi:sugar lactone lactonase YvrE